MKLRLPTDNELIMWSVFLLLIGWLFFGCGYQIQVVDVRDKYIQEIQEIQTQRMRLWQKIDSLETELDECNWRVKK